MGVALPGQDGRSSRLIISTPRAIEADSPWPRWSGIAVTRRRSMTMADRDQGISEDRKRRQATTSRGERRLPALRAGSGRTSPVRTTQPELLADAGRNIFSFRVGGHGKPIQPSASAERSRRAIHLVAAYGALHRYTRTSHCDWVGDPAPSCVPSSTCELNPIRGCCRIMVSPAPGVDGIHIYVEAVLVSSHRSADRTTGVSAQGARFQRCPCRSAGRRRRWTTPSGGESARTRALDRSHRMLHAPASWPSRCCGWRASGRVPRTYHRRHACTPPQRDSG